MIQRLWKYWPLAIALWWTATCATVKGSAPASWSTSLSVGAGQSVATPPTRLREWTFGTTTTTPIPFTSLAITVNSLTKFPQSILIGNTGPTTLTFNLEATATATVTSGGANISIPPTGALSFVNVDGVWKGLSVVRPDSTNGTVTAWCSY